MSNISQKLTYLNGTKTKLKNVINYSGANITDDTFRSYSKKLYDKFVDFVTNGTGSLYNSLPKVTGENTELTLNNTANAVLKLDLKGNTSQDEEPTPENPQQIHVVTGDNDITIKNQDNTQSQTYRIDFGGKNKYNINSLTTSNCTYEILNNSITVTATYTYAHIEQKIDNLDITKQYRLSFTGDTAPWFTILDENKTKISEAYNSKAKKFTPATSTTYIRIYATTSASSATKTFTEIQVEEGSATTRYSRYVENPIELCKIGEYEDKLFKNTTDNPLYNADLELNKWYKYGAVGKVVLDGSENITYNSGSSWKFRYTIQDANFTNASNEKATLLSNYFDAGIWNNSQNNQIATTLSSPKLIGIRYDNITSLADFKTWLSTHNTTLYYALETPTYTLLDDTLQEQLDEIYYNAVSYEDETNISQTNADLPFVIGASAIKKYSE